MSIEKLQKGQTAQSLGEIISNKSLLRLKRLQKDRKNKGY